MTVWNQDLSGTHLEIAASDATRIAVLAGPGTGKTTYGLIRRVARLLETGTKPQSILLISFTRTAVQDLQQKLSELGIPGADDIRAQTLTGFCYLILREERVLSTTGRIPRLLLKHEELLMLRDIRLEGEHLDDLKKQLRALEAGWARSQTDHPGLAITENDKSFAHRVLSWLQYHKGMLIGEVVPLAHAYLKAHPLSSSIENVGHVLVDEYQDLNKIEQDFVDIVCARSKASLCIIGDDDQSIYGFKHAHPDGILQRFNDSTFATFSLNKCGRCPKEILDAANSLISQEPERSKPPLSALKESHGRLFTLQWPTLDDELDGIATAIAFDSNDDSRFNSGETLVLVQRQDIGERLKNILRSRGVEAHSYFGQEPVRSTAAQRGLALFQFALCKDKIALRVLLGIDNQTGHSKAYTQIQGYAKSNNVSELDILERLLIGRIPGFRSRKIIDQYRKIKVALNEFSLEDLDEAIDVLFPDQDPVIRDIRAIALESAVGAKDAKEVEQRIVSRLTLLDVPQDPDFVRIMSLHKSKGLTSKSVYIVAALDGVVPKISRKLSFDEAEAAMAEQRRLMYVAVTRASEQLVISYCRTLNAADAIGWGIENRTMVWEGGKNVALVTASPFVQELGDGPSRAKLGNEWLEGYAL